MLRKLGQSWENISLMARYEGICTTLLFIAYKILSQVGIAAKKDCLGVGYFDYKTGLRTSAIVDPDDLDIPEDRKELTPGHAPTAPHAFQHVMSKLTIDWKEFQFIDFGSGAGRVLILASAYPFCSIRGVELSQDLHDLACRNIRDYSNDSQACHDIKSICEDAVKFQVPLGHLVAYFYNPFEGSIFEQVICNIDEARRRSKSKVFIVYCHPTQHSTFDSSGNYCKIYTGFHGHDSWHIYESVN